MTDPTKAIKDALEAGPTPGPWLAVRYKNSAAHCVTLTPGFATGDIANVLAGLGARKDSEVAANAQLIAACNPTAIRSLLSRLEEAERGSDRYETVRRMNPKAFLDAYILNQRTGKPFDEVIDDLKPFVRPAAMKEQSK